jgi:retron-type reverse transcriptase
VNIDRGFCAVYDADLASYFGTIVRRELMAMLQKRIGDKDVLRLIGKWLNAGVIDAGRLLPRARLRAGGHAPRAHD